MRLDRRVGERSHDDAAVEVDLQPGRIAGFAEFVDKGRHKLIESLRVPIVRIDLGAVVHESFIRIDGRICRRRARLVERAGPVDMRRVEDEVGRCRLLPSNREGSLRQDAVQEHRRHTEDTVPIVLPSQGLNRLCGDKQAQRGRTGRQNRRSARRGGTYTRASSALEPGSTCRHAGPCMMPPSFSSRTRRPAVRCAIPRRGPRI